MQDTSELLKEIDRLKSIVYVDSLTKLYNRRYFDEVISDEWQRAIRHQISISLLYFDLNGFKQVNDRYGHKAGDRLLQNFAAGLRAIPLRSHDILARLGGDEFAIVLPDSSRFGATRISESVQDAAKQAGIGCSIGISCCVPLPGSRYEDFVSSADAEMYRYKPAKNTAGTERKSA